MINSLPPALVSLAQAQSGALLGSQIANEVGDRRLLALVRQGAVNKLWYNAYAVPELSVPGPETPSARSAVFHREHHAVGVITRLMAAELSLRRPVVACLDTAAELLGFDIDRNEDTHILAAQDWPSHREGLVHHRPELIRSVQRMDGHYLTDPAETALRVAARHRHPAKSLAVLDAALRHTCVTVPELTGLAGEMHIRGIRALRTLAPLADPSAESPGESWLRWVCLDGGLPTPTTQIPVKTAFGDYWIDLGWPERKVGCEYEGVEFHTGSALTRDRQRYNALIGEGWLMLGVTSTMVWTDRERLVGQIEHFLRMRSNPLFRRSA